MDIDSLEALLRVHKELTNQIRELEDQKKEISKNLLTAFPPGIKKYTTPCFNVFRQERISFRTTLEEARVFHAVKTEETVDKSKLASLHSSGTTIPGITHTEYVLVKEITPKT